MFVSAPCWRRQLAPSAAFRRQQETCYFQVTIEEGVGGRDAAANTDVSANTDLPPTRSRGGTCGSGN